MLKALSMNGDNADWRLAMETLNAFSQTYGLQQKNRLPSGNISKILFVFSRLSLTRSGRITSPKFFAMQRNKITK